MARVRRGVNRAMGGGDLHCGTARACDWSGHRFLMLRMRSLEEGRWAATGASSTVANERSPEAVQEHAPTCEDSRESSGVAVWHMPHDSGAGQASWAASLLVPRLGRGADWACSSLSRRRREGVGLGHFGKEARRASWALGKQGAR